LNVRDKLPLPAGATGSRGGSMAAVLPSNRVATQANEREAILAMVSEVRRARLVKRCEPTARAITCLYSMMQGKRDLRDALLPYQLIVVSTL
jgi:hypothetical protein